MKSFWKIAELVSCLAWSVASIAGESTCEPDGLQPSSAIYRICMPPAEAWNGDLVVYAHGYVSQAEPFGIPEEQLIVGDTSLPEVINLLGFAFATTSYRDNGLVVREGVLDILELVALFESQHGKPGHVYLVGPSEGGLVTALALEQYPDVFDGGVAACGPIGDFRAQLDYVGDFRVLFDYYFPGLLPGSPTMIPAEVMQNWESIYVPSIRAAILANVPRTREFLRVARGPVDSFDSSNLLNSIENTVLTVLWYNVFGTNDAIVKLGGQPFDNATRYYFGSQSDWLLNLGVARFSAEPAAIQNVALYYQTTGELNVPVVTPHTVSDEIIFYRHENLYARKLAMAGNSSMSTRIPIFRYGHCQFTIGELIFSFALVVRDVTGRELSDVEAILQRFSAESVWAPVDRRPEADSTGRTRNE
ncbi:MAG: hypothetical protein AABZ47_13945 [Planctomycetota bacterium]